MFAKRLAVGGLVAISVVAGLGIFNSSYGQSSDTGPGTTYGGVRDLEWVWMRLDPSRNVVLALQVPWAASGKRCSNGKAYTSLLYAGAEYEQTILINSDGTFGKTVVDRYRESGIRYVETQTVKGTLTDDRVTGTVAGNAKRTLANGRVVRCKFGPLKWSAVD